MRQPSSLRWQRLKQFYQQQWVLLLLGSIATLAVLVVWQQLITHEQGLVQHSTDVIASDLPLIILSGSLIGVWTLVYMIYLRQRAEHQAQRGNAINQQLQDEIIRRQQIEVSLRESEERLQLALEASGEGWWDWNLVTNEVDRSPRYLRILGYDVSELSNVVDSWSALVHPDDFPRMMDRLTDHLRDGSVRYACDYRMRTRSGTWIWISDYGKVVARDADNRPLRMIGTFKDINDRKQAEKALQESEERYRHLIDHLNAGFVVHAPNSQVLQCNATACELLGLSMDQILGKEAIASNWYFLREDGTFMTEAEYPVNRVLSTRSALKNYVVGLNRGHSSPVWALVTAFPEFDVNQQLKQIVVTFIDISELKQAEAELREMAKVMENVVSGISKLDVQGYYRYVNQAYANITGYQPEALTGMPWLQTVHPDDVAKMTAAYQQMLQNGRVEVEAKGLRQDGSVFYKQVMMIAFYNGQHQFVGHYCFMKDITDRKQAEFALEKELLRSKALFNTSIDGVVVIDHQGNVAQTSLSFAQMLGYSIEETLKLNVADWDAQWTREELQHMRESNAFSPVFETRHRRRDGSLYDVEISYSRVQLDGEIMHFCICRDISDRKRIEANRQAAEAALIASQQRYQNLVENSPDIIERFDLQLRHLYVSPVLPSITGLSTEAFLGKTCRDLSMDAAMVDAWESAAATLLQTGQKQVIEFSIPTLQGIRSFEMAIAPELSDQQTIESILCISRDITERKQVAIALQNSQARLAGILEIASDAIISVNADQQIILFNQGAERIFGYTSEAILGQPLSVLLPDRFAPAHQCHVTRYEQSDEKARQMAQRGAIFGRRKDGTEFPAEASISKLNLNGEMTFTTFLRDITERQQAEAALQQSEATKQAIIQAIPDLMMRMRVDGSFIEFISNSSFNVVNPKHHCGSTNVYDVLPLDLAQKRLYYIDQALHAGTTQVYEQHIVVNGDARYEEVRIVPLPHDEVLVMVRDITDRKQAEAELRHQKEMFQAIVDHIPVMIVLFDANGCPEFINPELERVLGWSLTDWQQRDILADCYPDSMYRQKVLDHMLAAAGNWRDFTTLNATGQALETTWANVPLSGGRFLGIGQDISDRKHKERALQQAMEVAETANLAKSTFLANMSHELRTPLNVILGFVQVMNHDPYLTSNQRDDLQTIRRSGDHLLNLINNVLDLSKIEAGHFTLEESAFDLIALLHTLRTMMSQRASSKQICLEFDIASTVPQFVIADEQKLRQILLNLLSNAIKFTEQGQVKLLASVIADQLPSAPDLGSSVVGNLPTINQAITTSNFKELIPNNKGPITLQFQVVDTGVGIAPDEQSMIFNAFVQAEAGKKSVSGTGLGLTISRKLLELMHGDISVCSTPNEGSTFTVTVPVYPTISIDTQLDVPDRLIIGLAPGQAQPRVLVVDDQRENRLLLIRLLAQLGVNVREATNGQEAISIWQEWQPDLTWMDIRMPGMDGYEATKWIRAAEKQIQCHREHQSNGASGNATGTPVLPSIIIALTAQASHSDRALALAAGCNDYISKPFREETLYLKLKEYLGLEYLYAEPNALSERQPTPIADDPIETIPMSDPTLLASLPPAWLQALEHAAICGTDRAIVELVAQLSPELASLRVRLLELAENYQFEQILQLIRTNVSP